MICLAIDSTSNKLAIALLKGDEDFCRTINVGQKGHSALLMPTVREMLLAHGVSADMLDHVAVNVGPGSFTGIRIGVAAMTALAFATGAKRIAVTSFQLIAHGRDSVFAAVDAGHGNVYGAVCEGGEVKEAAFYSAEEAAKLTDAVYEPVEDLATALAATVRLKAARREYVDVFEPFYMRKSQAERTQNDV